MYVWERHLGASSDEDFQDSYRGHPRVELTGLFTSDRKRLLDVGCASGATSALLKELIPGLEAWGVEPDPVAAQLAGQRLDRVFASKLEDIDLLSEGLRHGDVDAVLLADVLEHMYDPWRALTQIKPFLSADAQVVISLPNVRNVGLVSDLVDGRFDYQKWGLLDITHIRFFTLDGAMRMLHETGYGVRRIQANIDPMLSHVMTAGVPADGTLRFDRMTVSSVEPRELVEMCALQFFIVASPVQLELVWGGAVAQPQETPEDQPASEQGEAAGNDASAEAASQSHIVELDLNSGSTAAEPGADSAASDDSGGTPDASATPDSPNSTPSGTATSDESAEHDAPHTPVASESANGNEFAQEAHPAQPEPQSLPDDEQNRQGG